MIEPRIAVIDSANWYAVLLVVQPRFDAKPTIRCVGFKDRRDRDRWLEWFSRSMMALWDAVPEKI